MILNYQKYRPVIDATAFVAPSADVVGRVKIGRGASVWFGAVLRGDIERVSVGDGANIQDQCVLHVDHDMPCVVKKNATVGHQAVIHGAVIGEGSLIGMGARVLSGAVIGRNAVVGAGSVVLEGAKIPAGTLAVGTPAKVVRRLKSSEIRRLERSAAEYRKLAVQYRKESSLLLHPPSIAIMTDLNSVL